MNIQLKSKFLLYLASKKANKGFTLIELLVVVLIIGVLAAIALPNLLGQVAKGRQAEAKNTLGALNRAQQAYRLEELTFADEDHADKLPVKFTMQYYELKFDNTADDKEKTFAGYATKALAQYSDDILEYGAGVRQTSNGLFSQVICEEYTLQTNRSNRDPFFAQAPASTLTADCDSTKSKIINK